jgi:hypothetical protein
VRRLDNRTMSTEDPGKSCRTAARSRGIYLIFDMRLIPRDIWEVLQVVGEIAA